MASKISTIISDTLTKVKITSGRARLASRHNHYRNKYVGKLVGYEEGFGYQCVGQVKHYVKEVHGKTLGSFGGSAKKGWETGNPFIGLPFERVINFPNNKPSIGDVIFFNIGKYWHVAIAGRATLDFVEVLEQNMGNGDGYGQDDAVRFRKVDGYKDVVGWFHYNG